MPDKKKENYGKVIKRKHDYLAIQRELKKRSLRDYTLFHIGTNYYILPKELLALKETDLGNLKLTNKSKRLIKEYTSAVGLNEYLFPTRRHDKPLTSRSYGRMLKQLCEDLELPIRPGIDSLRKTYIYNQYIKGSTLADLGNNYNHIMPGRLKALLELTECDVLAHESSKTEKESVKNE